MVAAAWPRRNQDSVESARLLGGLCGRLSGASEDSGLKIGVPEVPEEKGEYVGPVRDLLRDGIGDTVASVVIHTEEDGVGSIISSLQTCGHLGTLPGIDSGIIGACGDERCGILGAWNNVLICGHLVEGLEAVWFLDCAELGNVGWAVGARLLTEHVGARYAVYCGGEEVGTLGDGAADQDSASRLAPDAEAWSRSVFRVDKVLRRGYEIAPGVRLGELFAGEMPAFAEFATSSDVGDREHASTLQPGHVTSAERGCECISIGAIADQRSGCGAVTDQTLLIDDGERERGAVQALDGDLFGDEVGGVDSVRDLQVQGGQRCGPGIVAEGVAGHSSSS